MNHYKSWSDLNKRLTALLCDEWKDRITFFLTRYHQVHNSYGRAAIRLDGRELVCFSWVEMYRQEADLNRVWHETGVWSEGVSDLKEKWDQNAVYSDMDFLAAATSFLEMPITEALCSENGIVRILAILDRRVGKRTLSKIKEQGRRGIPDWVWLFYKLRLESV